ncbi:hypothetical protein CRM79_03470 [Pantoea agglomerans]|nr:hypothetical protein CRM79_03470 [Pantoea agglomerans]
MAMTELISEAVTKTIFRSGASILYSAFYFVQITFFCTKSRRDTLVLLQIKATKPILLIKNLTFYLKNSHQINNRRDFFIPWGGALG